MSDGIVNEVRGTCQIGGSNCGLAAVRAEISVNNWPNAQVWVTVGQTSDGAAKQIDGKIFKLIGSWQDKILNSKLTGSVSWNDDMGISETISGYVVSVQQEITYGNMCAAALILPEYARVDAVNLAPYKSVLGLGHALKNAYGNTPQLKSGLMDYIREVVEYMIGKWDIHKDEAMANMDDKQKQMYEEQHEYNKDAIDIFYQILDNSNVGEEYTKESMKVLAGSPTDRLFQTIVACLTQAQGSFLSCIVAIANQFRLVYVPEPNSPGRYVRKQEMVFGDARTGKGAGGKTSIVQADARSAGSGYLPVSGILTVLDHQAGFVHDQYAQTTASSSAGARAKTHGRTIAISPPMWVPTSLALSDVGKDGKIKKRKSYRPSMRKDKLAKRMQDAEDGLAGYFQKLLDGWCKEELCAQLLGGSVTMVTTFLDDFYCGGRKKEEFGSGYVGGCAVEIQLRPGGMGTARTIYTYSHVLYTGASMPDIS